MVTLTVEYFLNFHTTSLNAGNKHSAGIIIMIIKVYTDKQ